ncbi:hypothetical protein SLE2022_398220 [Rubroshorea leprosula]
MGGLSFRALHEFNLAMLGKQGWRLLVNPESLAARLMKRCRRLIGDGCSINIWTDPWLPGNTQFYVQTPRLDGCELRYVCDLIDDDSHSWGHTLVQEIFNPHEAQLILSMPVSWVQRYDGWKWSFAQHGAYSVRSGYHRAMTMSGPHDGPSASSSGFRGNYLWNLDIPKKVQWMIWQAYKNILPTMDNLKCR